MNQTIEQLGKEYVRKLKKKMKLYKDYPELFEDDEFRQKYVSEGDRLATLAFLYEKMCNVVRRKTSSRRPAAGTGHV